MEEKPEFGSTLTNMKEFGKQLISFAIKNGYFEDIPKGQKEGLVDRFEQSFGSIPDYTIVWGVIDYLGTSKLISNDAKVEVLKALSKLESEDKCTMGDNTK